MTFPPGLALNGAHGTVFKLNTDGTGFTVLKAFGSEGSPHTLLQGRDDALHGTTDFGHNLQA
jgi:hypothetical protein